MTAPTLLDALRGAVALAQAAPVPGWATSSDPELSELIAAAAELKRIGERHVAFGAGEVARRSGPALGLSGFAQRAGYRTVEEYLKAETGATGREAAATSRAGAIATTGGVLGAALREGRVSVPAADAIRSGLGDACEGVPARVLEQATEKLCEESVALDPDRLHKRARELRDEIDEAGIVDRERAHRAARSLRLVKQPDGMTRLSWLLDPESAAIVSTVYDRATSPRRGGPRFVDPHEKATASRIADDDRTTEQLASDAFTELLRQSAHTDPGVLVGGDEPSVRVLVSAGALATGTGHGALESGDTVALPTVHRLACAGGILPVILDTTGQVLALGRTRRLYNRAQRRALAVRDGGCMWPGCQRPPSWIEAHHIRPWSEGGTTDLANGISLCRHHHLRLHDENWSITRRQGRYWLAPPPGGGGAPVPLESKSRALRELLTA